MTLNRREFIALGATAATAAALGVHAEAAAPIEPIIDIHQHLSYGGQRDAAWKQIGPARTDAALLAHQRKMGVTKTILLPAGRPLIRPSTLNGKANGLDTTISGNAEALAFVRAHPGEYFFGANEVPDIDEAPGVIEKYLKLGAVLIGEQKFNLECDSPASQRLYALAADHGVPILMHWQAGSFNLGFERFHRMLQKFPKTVFIGHAQTWWANIDQANVDDPRRLYPTGPVKPGGLTDRYLADYPNMFGDLSAGSGEGAFKRDPEHAKAFLARHQDKLLYGSDCDDSTADPADPRCCGVRQIAQVRQWAPTKAAERKILYENARKLFRF